MLRWAPYPFIRITVSFIAGILLYIYTGKEFGYTAGLFAFFVVLFAAAVFFARKARTTFANNIAGIAGILCFFVAGIWLAAAHDEIKDPEHLSKLESPPAYYTGTVTDYVLQKTGYQSTVLAVDRVLVNGEWRAATGNIQLSVPDDSLQEYQLSYGDQLLVKGAPLPVAAPANPAQFNYQAFLANKNIYHRHYLQAHQYLKTGSDPPNDIQYVSIQLRRELDALLRANIPDRREYGISSALVLGVKDEIDNAIKDAYAATGTMHVLAVSGLHVGLIYGLLMLFLSKFTGGYKQRIGVAVLIVILLWLYAFITGLSPSVLRATVMFSIVAVANATTKRSSIYNTLAFAAFVLLWYNPYFLLDVGFQLSFLAVLGIVYLQPRLSRLLHFNSSLADKVWGLFTVSVAAQLATLPLGIFYFHQFPVYFWLANLIIVPLSTLVLYVGVTALAFNWVPLVGALLFKLLFGLIWCMNELNLLLTKLPVSIINGLTITEVQTWLQYALLMLLILLFARKKLVYLAAAVCVVGILAFQQILEIIELDKQEVLAVYQLRGNTAIAFVENHTATLLGSAGLTTTSPDFKFNVQPHLWQLGVQESKMNGMYAPSSHLNHTILPDSNSLVVWNGLKVLLISKPLKVIATDTTSFDYVVLSKNVRLWPDDLKHLKAKKVILDSSNAPWHTERLQKQLKEAGIAFYNVATSGAFVKDLN